MAWVGDFDLEALHYGELDFLGDVYVAVVVVDSFVALPLLEATFEKHDVLEVLLVYQVGDLLENGGQGIHHYEETQQRLNEALADVEFAALNLDVDLPIAKVFYEV